MRASRLSLASVGMGREPGSGGSGDSTGTGSSRMGTVTALARGLGFPGSFDLEPTGLPGFLFGARANTSAGMASGAGAAASSNVTLALVFTGVFGISEGVPGISEGVPGISEGVSGISEGVSISAAI